MANTRDIWHFIIISEGAIASVIRRIEAVTGDRAKEIFKQRSDEFLRSQELLNHPKDQVQAIEKLQEENTLLKKQIQEFLKDKANNLKSELKDEITDINGINFLSRRLDLDAAGMKDLSFELGGEIENLFLLLGSSQEGKALLSCYISKDLASSKDLNAGTIVRELGKYIKGGGGGQPFFATAGGKDPKGLDEALGKGKDYL